MKSVQSNTSIFWPCYGVVCVLGSAKIIYDSFKPGTLLVVLLGLVTGVLFWQSLRNK